MGTTEATLPGACQGVSMSQKYDAYGRGEGRTAGLSDNVYSDFNAGYRAEANGNTAVGPWTLDGAGFRARKTSRCDVCGALEAELRRLDRPTLRLWQRMDTGDETLRCGKPACNPNLTLARALLAEANGGCADEACRTCRGSGKFPLSGGLLACSECGGSGQSDDVRAPRRVAARSVPDPVRAVRPRSLSTYPPSAGGTGDAGENRVQDDGDVAETAAGPNWALIHAAVARAEMVAHEARTMALLVEGQPDLWAPHLARLLARLDDVVEAARTVLGCELSELGVKLRPDEPRPEDPVQPGRRSPTIFRCGS